MKLTSVRIQNYKGLKDVTVPLSQFGCLIGENNSGKSSVLQALLVLLPGSAKKPGESDFFDRTLPIRIEIHVDGITDEDLARISMMRTARASVPMLLMGVSSLYAW